MCEVLGFSRSSCSPPCSCRWCGVHDEVCTCGQVCVTQASVALPRPYIGGVDGPCWILWILYEVLLVVPADLIRLLSGSQWSCWSYEISQWEPTCLCTYTCGDTWGLLLHFIPVFLVLTAVLHKCIWCVVEAFRGNQTWIWGVSECLCVCCVCVRVCVCL